MSGAVSVARKSCLEESSQSIPARFADVAAACANAVALSGNRTDWTYAELDQRSSAVAVHFLELSARDSEPVALLMEHGPVLISAILGALKAGIIYLALDPNSSREQLCAALTDSRARLLIADEANLSLARNLAGEQLLVLKVDQELPAPSGPTNLPDISSEAPAWLMYTSGSTGKPKAVAQNHRGVVHDANVYREMIGLRPDDRLSLLTAFSRSASATPLFTALLSGATLCPFDVRSKGIERLGQWLGERGITVYHSVPSVFRRLARTHCDNGVFSTLRWLRLGGEPMVHRDFEVFRERFPENCRLINSLSSTETGPICAAILDKQTQLPSDRVPVGRAVPGAEVFLVNDDGDPVLAGEPGRIAVRSSYLRQGYWLRPEETERKFCAHPQYPGTRTFVTHDRGRFLADGNLEHLGRDDEVVKVLGLRADLSELERLLRSSDFVDDAAVSALEDPNEGHRLVAYVVPRKSAAHSFESHRRALQKSFPVPCRFITLKDLPLLANGKIDRLRLSQPLAEADRSDSRDEMQSVVHREIAHLWQEMLGVRPTRLADDFFALGGDSLAALTMLTAIEKSFGLVLPVPAWLESPTVEVLGDLIKKSAQCEKNPSIIALRRDGNLPPLFCVPSAGSSAFEFRLLASHLSEEQPVFAFQSPGLDGCGCCLRSVEQTADLYLEAMRQQQRQGPYHLCGSSFGGVVAFEMARRLAQAGDKVGFLGLLDSFGGKYPKPRKVLSLRKRLKLASLSFLSRGNRTRFDLSAFKKGLNERSKRWLVRRFIEIDSLLRFRAVRCPAGWWSLYVQEICFAARRRYPFGSFPGKIDLFRAENQPPPDLFEEDPLLGWAGLADRGIEVHHLPGYHNMYLREEPVVALLAHELTACLDSAR